MTQSRRWGAWGSLYLGIWLLFAPLLLGSVMTALWVNDAVSGIFLGLCGILALRSRTAWIGWVLVILGVWLQMAPLAFWAPTAALYVNDTGCGVAAMLLGFRISHGEESTKGERPRGWSFNPSAWPHRLLIALLALLCSCLARYMAIFQLGYRESVWDPFFLNGTRDVISSALSKSFPLSDAGLGALCYTLEFVLAWQGGCSRWKERPWLVLSFAFLVIPVGAISVLLIILQPLLIGTWCSWCLAIAFLMLLMIVLAAPEFVASVRYLAAAQRAGKSAWTLFWKGERGKASLLEKGGEKSVQAGWTIPLSAILCSVLGMWIVVSSSMSVVCSNLSTIGFIVGPLAIACALVSCAEVFRPVRYVQLLLGLILAFFASKALFAEGGCAGSLSHLVTGLLLMAACLPRGRVLERYG